MEYSELIRDFANRTYANLKAIERLHAEGESVYETTQLINSMLGLVVMPRERHALAKNFDKRLDEMTAEGWPPVRFSMGGERVQTLRQFTELLRNSIVHLKWDVRLQGSGEIEGLQFWQGPRGQKRRTAEITLTVDQLRAILELYIRLMTVATTPTG